MPTCLHAHILLYPCTTPFTKEEIGSVISRLNSSSALSPVDQIPYTIFQRCPSLLPALVYMYNCCWTTQTVPCAWKVGIVHLLGKKKAPDDPSNPSNFRPIALTSCASKVFTSLVNRSWLAYMVDNGFLNTASEILHQCCSWLLRSSSEDASHHSGGSEKVEISLTVCLLDQSGECIWYCAS